MNFKNKDRSTIPPRRPGVDAEDDIQDMMNRNPGIDSKTALSVWMIKNGYDPKSFKSDDDRVDRETILEEFYRSMRGEQPRRRR